MSLDFARHALNRWRAARQSWRARRALPDPRWRDACRRGAVPLDRVHIDDSGALQVKFSRAVLGLPACSAAYGVMGLYTALSALESGSDVVYEWDAEREALRIQSGLTSYWVATYEQVHTLDEVLRRGDYDLALRTAPLILDVGANVGFTSLFLATTNPDAIIVAAEPLPVPFAQAQQNLLGNPHLSGRVHLHNVALAAEDGRQAMTYVPGYSVTSRLLAGEPADVGAAQHVTVDVRRATGFLDEAQRRWPDRPVVVKLDCEGSERAILGALAEDGRLKDVHCVIMEWHRAVQGGREVEELMSLLRRGNFDVYIRGRLDPRRLTGLALAFRTVL